MHRDLLQKAFIKAEKELGSKKITHLSNYLSNYIIDNCNEAYGEKILRVYYNKIIENSTEKIYLREHAAESLSHFLGYTNFLDFAKNNTQNNLDNSKIKPTNTNKKLKILVVLALIATCLFIYHFTTKERWMVWQENQYIEVDFDTEKYNLTQYKIYKEERIKLFKKIIPNCNTIFFNTDETVNIWYGKNKNKKLEYFTNLGLHPETGKTLKPITKYMIDKHICVQ